MRLDLAIGEGNQIESNDKEKLKDIATRIKDLNSRLNDIRREQVFQRVRGPRRIQRAPTCMLTRSVGTGS